MNNNEYVKNYIEKINFELDAYMDPVIRNAKTNRYPLYCNCIDRAFYICDELFSTLNEEQKKYYICYAYTILLDADISTRNRDDNSNGNIRLAIEPNRLSKIICKLMNVEYYDFEEMQKVIYNQRIQFFPDLENSFYKVGDVIRDGIINYKVIDVYMEYNRIMVKAHSLYDYENMTKIIIKPEADMIGTYRIVSSTEHQ